MKQIEDYEAYLSDVEYIDNIDYADNSECEITTNTDLDFSLYYM